MISRREPTRENQVSDVEHYRRVAVELVRAMRGGRSCAALSRRLGYASNAVGRWEAGRSFPTAARFIAVCEMLNPQAPDCFERFFGRRPWWCDALGGERSKQVTNFLRDLRGKTPIAEVAKTTGYSRFAVARWVNGTAQPKLPELLHLVDACSRRMPDLIATWVDPARLPSLVKRWQRTLRAKEMAYAMPHSHAVLRALELTELPQRAKAQIHWLAGRLSLSPSEVEEALDALVDVGHARRTHRGYKVVASFSVDTGSDPKRARLLKAQWGRVALERLASDAPGHFGYSLFAVSRVDMLRLRELHLEYVRAMRTLVSQSTPSECVGLYCSQLLDLSAVDNVLRD